jgi:uncharacterized DUF497 family protein
MGLEPTLVDADGSCILNGMQQLEWDEAKRQSNLNKHGIDFRDLGPVFDDAGRIEVEDRRRDYGEPRRVLFGSLHERLLHVTYAVRGSAHRIISARKANLREQRFYERYRADHQGDPDP